MSKELLQGEVPKFKKGMVSKLASQCDITRQEVHSRINKRGWIIGVVNGKQAIYNPRSIMELNPDDDYFESDGA